MHRFFIGYIGGHAGRLHATLFELSCQCVGFVRVKIGDHQACPSLGERAAKLCAKQACCAGYDCDAATEIEKIR
jgi:hypothetical protein